MGRLIDQQGHEYTKEQIEAQLRLDRRYAEEAPDERFEITWLERAYALEQALAWLNEPCPATKVWNHGRFE